MTATEYAARVTELIDAKTGGDFTYPESFESDVRAYRQQRITPERAAFELLIQYRLND